MPAHVPKEIRAEILAKIKGGARATEVADQYGVSRKTVYGWLGGEARSHVSFVEYQKIKRERDGLLALVGELVLKTRGRGEKSSLR